jgi:pseudouridine kinase
LQATGVSTHFSPTLPDQRTGSYVAMLSATGDLELAVADMAIMDRFSPDMLEDIAAVFDGTSVVCFDANLPFETLQAGLQIAASLNLRTVVEPVSVPKASKLATLLHLIDTVTPNRDELAAIAEMPLSTREDLESAAALVHSRGVRRVIVTLGGDGVFCLDDDGPRWCPSASVSVKDATGAGDAFTSGLIYGYDQDWSVADCIDFGQRLAARILVSTDSVLGGQDL